MAILLILFCMMSIRLSNTDIGVRTGVARWAMAPPNASAGAPRRAVNAGSAGKVGRGPPESKGPPLRVPLRFIGF